MTLRTAVIGVGMMGRNHARVYGEMPGVELVGVADEHPEAAEQVVKRYGGTGYTDYIQLLDEQKPDAVTIAVPTDEHLEVALQVIQRGIHLLIEKPIAYSVEQAQQIITAAEKAGVILTVGHIERFNPAVIALKQHIVNGDLGRVFQIDARRQSPFPARVKDVGVVIDLAVHDVDVMRYITGTEVVRVFAETERQIHSTQEDLMTGMLRLQDGSIGTLTINWLTPTKIRELYVTGERGMFRVDYLLQDLYYFENATTSGSEWETIRTLRGVSEGQMTRYVVAKKEPLRAEQEHFLAAVRGEVPVLVTGLDGLKALALAQALVQSGIDHQAVQMEV
jgi:predicted dehydrogenase